MTTYSFNRTIEVHVAGFIIREPKIDIDITLEAGGAENGGTVLLYNLSPDHENVIIDRRGEPIEVYAGYGGSPPLLFSGVVQRAFRLPEANARVLSVTVSSMAEAPGTLGGLTNRSYQGEVAVRELVRLIITEDMGFSVIGLDVIPLTEVLEDGFAHTGISTAALKRLLIRRSISFYEDKGAIHLTKQGVADGVGKFTVTPETGLVGTPSQTDEGAKAQVLLNPLIELASSLTIKSQALNGTYKVVALRHHGTNWLPGPFLTELELHD